MAAHADETGSQHYDVLIRGGTVYTGTLDPPIKQDVGIVGDRIKAIGNLDVYADKIINATNCIVTPGFIDIHTHTDLAFLRMSKLKPQAFETPEWKGNHCYIHQGVTTVVTGNCGMGFTDTAKWLDQVNSFKFGTNVYHLMPHGAVRQELFGADQPQELSKNQLASFKSRISDEMEKGAIGLSTGLEYPPGSLASTDELIDLAKVVRRFGGIYTSHMRDESGKANVRGESGVISSIKEVIRIGDEAELPVQISHLKILLPFGTTNALQMIELIESARGKGLDITADQYPYDANSTTINYFLPDKIKTEVSVKPEYKTELGKEKLREAIKEVFRYFPPEKWIICEGEYAGENLKQIGSKRQQEPADIYVELVIREVAPLGIFFTQDMDFIKQLASHDYVFTASDGWTHPSAFGIKAHPRLFGTFIKKIRQFAMDEKIMNMTDVIRSMTSLPASKIGVKKRGMIVEGNYADIAVIDLNKIEAPATYEISEVFSLGVVYLFVNGIMEIENGKATENRGGRALKRSD